MKLDRIVKDLDSYFNIYHFPPDMPFSSLVPKVYESNQICIKDYARSDFLNSFHGLMLNNGKNVRKIYTIVFLSEEIDKVFERDESDILLISHHPLNMETRRRGFLPLSEKYLKEMQKRSISVYVLHTPLDVHERVSTAGALSKALDLAATKRYYESSIGFGGVYGNLDHPIKFQDFLTTVSHITDVNDLNFIARQDFVNKIGILPGGTRVEGILETSDLGCDTLLTGTYYNQIQNEIGKQHREAFEKVQADLQINVIECSHYASEAIVMKTDMIKLCQNHFGLACEFIPQDDPWY